MKIRFGALALVVMLAACSSQDQAETGVRASKGNASTTNPENGAAISGYSNDSKRTLGSAPDRGELFGYKKGAAVLHKGAYTLRPIALSEEHAIRGVATGMMTLPGPNGEQIKIRYQRHEESPDGNWSWIGRVVGGDAGREAIITFGEHAVFGTIPQAKGPSLQLTTERGIAYLVQADASRLLRGVRVGGDAKVPATYGASSAHETESLVASATQKIQAQALGVSPKAVPAANTVDLVAGYSNGLATRLGGTSVAVTKLVNLVAAANAALTNSNVNGQIRLVNVLQVSYADNTDNGTALNELTGNNGTGPVTVPASLAPLRAARETYGADLVTLVRDFKSENNGCGIAWLLGANQAPITIAGDAPFAYSVISEGSYDLSGSTYYCEDITLGHELAHNMGSAHDVGNAGGNSGRYPYSYGYKTAAAQGNFFTVMAYGDNGQTLYRVFSNPLISTCGGLACGVADQADNARSLNQTIPVVASFRISIAANSERIVSQDKFGMNNDNRADLFWRNSSSASFAYWLMNGTTVTTTRTVEPSVPNTYSQVGRGNLNGDAFVDIVWTSAARDLWLWSGTGTSFNAQFIANYPPDWEPIALLDINGDGRSDIIFRNQGTQKVAVWIMNGTVATSVYNVFAEVPSNYTLAGTGDFNGDGRGDMLWTSSALDLWMWTSNGSDFIPTFVATYPSPWRPTGTGDVNGDGRTDVLWRNATTSQVAYWIMNGAVVTTTRNASPLAPSNYWLASVGDYNGDGRADMIWTSTGRDLWAWTGNGTDYTASFVDNYPVGWSPEPSGP